METRFAGLNASQAENLPLFNALEKAQEAYGEAKRKVYEEARYEEWEDVSEMNEGLQALAQRVSEAYEGELHRSGELTAGFSDEELMRVARLYTAHIHDYAKRQLENLVPREYRDEIGWEW
jgi:stress response protein YsnF